MLNGWNCPKCGSAHAPHVETCPVVESTRDLLVDTTSRNASPCAFDSLPPGAYHLVCDCPRCRPTMVGRIG